MIWKNDGLLITCLLFAVFGACRRDKNSVKEIKDHGLTVQVIKMEGEPAGGNTNTASYSARLIPDKGLISEKDSKIKTALWYSMDSSFYLQAGKKKIYAEIIQPIANGLVNRYEYMLSFDLTGLKGDKWSLIYQDKFLNHRKYIIDKNQE